MLYSTERGERWLPKRHMWDLLSFAIAETRLFDSHTVVGNAGVPKGRVLRCGEGVKIFDRGKETRIV